MSIDRTVVLTEFSYFRPLEAGFLLLKTRASIQLAPEFVPQFAPEFTPEFTPELLCKKL